MSKQSESERQVIVPQSDIDALEAARLLMYELFPCDETDELIKIMKVTDAMWKITHRRYDEADGGGE